MVLPSSNGGMFFFTLGIIWKTYGTIWISSYGFEFSEVGPSVAPWLPDVEKLTSLGAANSVTRASKSSRLSWSWSTWAPDTLRDPWRSPAGPWLIHGPWPCLPCFNAEKMPKNWSTPTAVVFWPAKSPNRWLILGDPMIFLGFQHLSTIQNWWCRSSLAHPQCQSPKHKSNGAVFVQETLDIWTEYGETSVLDAFQTGNENVKSSYEYLAINQHNFVPRAAMWQQTKILIFVGMASQFNWLGSNFWYMSKLGTPIISILYNLCSHRAIGLLNFDSWTCVWANYANSLTWNVGPFWDDFPIISPWFQGSYKKQASVVRICPRLLRFPMFSTSCAAHGFSQFTEWTDPSNFEQFFCNLGRRRGPWQFRTEKRGLGASWPIKKPGSHGKSPIFPI